MTFEEALQEYETTAHSLVTLRANMRGAEVLLAKREAVIWMQDEVQAGSNEKARKSLFEAACDQDGDYQDLLRELETLRLAIARSEIDERVSRKWVDFQIAVVAGGSK